MAAAGAIASAVAVVGSAVMQSEAQRSAARAQERSAASALGFQQQQYADAMGRFQPYISTGEQALQKQAALSGALGVEAQQAALQEQSQSGQLAWLREQGMQGINQSASAAGGLGGGSRLKAISEFNQNLANQYMQQQFNNLGTVAGYGFGGAQALSGLGSTAAQGQAQTVMQSAATQGQLGIQQAQTYGQGLQNLASLYALYRPEDNQYAYYGNQGGLR